MKTKINYPYNHCKSAPRIQYANFKMVDSTSSLVEVATKSREIARGNRAQMRTDIELESDNGSLSQEIC